MLIYDGNILIAKFMGWEEDGAGILMNGNENPFLYKDGMGMPKIHLKYHRTWDELMPVVKKCKEAHELGYKGSSIEYGLKSIDMFVLWKAVIEFINWYSEQ